MRSTQLAKAAEGTGDDGDQSRSLRQSPRGGLWGTQSSLPTRQPAFQGLRGPRLQGAWLKASPPSQDCRWGWGVEPGAPPAPGASSWKQGLPQAPARPGLLPRALAQQGAL